MKILMLVNWKIKYANSVPEGVQPPDYYVSSEKYWFFRYFKDQDVAVDVVDVSSFKWLENFELNKIRFYIWQTLRVLPKLRKYDLVISHGMQSGIALCLLRRIFEKGKYKHIVFDIGAFNSAKEEGKALKLMQYASKSIDGVIYHTKSQVDYYKKCHPWLMDKCYYVPFGTDTEFFGNNKIAGTENTSAKNARVENTIATDPYILCVGSNKRDWKTLVEAYRLTGQKYKLRLIGNTDAEVLNMVKSANGESNNKNIEILDRVSIEELKNQISNAKFCVLPLKYMNYSFGQMTLLQQMALKKAVIVADVPSVSEYLNNDWNVKYIPENTASLRDKLEILMQDESLCNRLGDNASEAVMNRYNERIMAEKIEEIISKFVK